MNPDGSQNQQLPQQPVNQPSVPNKFYINQEFKLLKQTFAVTDGQNIVCVAKVNINPIKEHIDVFRDDACTQLIFTIQQEKAIAISKTYEVVSAAGQKMGAFKLQAMKSVMKEHWDIMDANNNLIGAIDQDSTTAMVGRMGGMMGGMFGGGGGAMGGLAMGTMIPQKFIASVNNQPVCVYQEELNVGVFFKMDIDFSSDVNNLFDRTLGIASAILLSSKHMHTE